MREDEIPLFYKWATQSDGTPFWYGELYGDKIPTFEEFIKDWKKYYFVEFEPEMGRCFVILLEKEPIGEINYNKISANRRVEIDIIIADDKNLGKGYGPDAIRTMIKYLFEKMDVKEVWVAAIKKNPRAVKAYKQAGFKTVNPPEDIKEDSEWTDKNLEEYVFFLIKSVP